MCQRLCLASGTQQRPLKHLCNYGGPRSHVVCTCVRKLGVCTDVPQVSTMPLKAEQKPSAHLRMYLILEMSALVGGSITGTEVHL